MAINTHKSTSNTAKQFYKMHGLGNDFVIFDQRESSFPISENFVKQIANRRYGIGCDQVIFLQATNEPAHACKVLIYNADGSQAEACGNAMRCISKLTGSAKVQVAGRTIVIQSISATRAAVNMGKPNFDWKALPASEPVQSVNLSGVSTHPAIAVNVGNPHLVIICNSLEDNLPLENNDSKYWSQYTIIDTLAPRLSTHNIFPNHINVDFVKVLSDHSFNIKVFERGVGFTQACGSGACASFAALSQLGMVNKKTKAQAIFDNGQTLEISYNPQNEIIMEGAMQMVYTGFIQYD